jgi:hypothetical protein
MKDPELERYVSAIEAHFARRRGREVVLTARDFELAGSWYEARVSLPAVLAGIDDAFAAGRSPSTLAHCRSFVESLVRPERSDRSR